MKGRKPKPTHLHLVNGNPGRRRRNQHEPKPPHVIPAPPEHMKGEHLVAWGVLTTKLDRLGMITELDAWAVELLVNNYVEVKKLNRVLNKKGRFVTRITKQGEEMEFSHPAFFQLSDAEKRLRAMMCEFGLTQSSRPRIHAEPPNKDKEEDPAAKYGL